MSSDINLIFNESILIELNISDLYSVFYKLFPVDVKFWWTILLEEKHHAALLQSGKEHFEPFKKFPNTLLLDNLEALQDTNKYILALIRKFKKAPPSRETAFNTALEIESSASELNFQKFMEDKNGPLINNIFRELNNEDKNHSKRIKAYMKEHGIEISQV